MTEVFTELPTRVRNALIKHGILNDELLLVHLLEHNTVQSFPGIRAGGDTLVDQYVKRKYPTHVVATRNLDSIRPGARAFLLHTLKIKTPDDLLAFISKPDGWQEVWDYPNATRPVIRELWSYLVRQFPRSAASHYMPFIEARPTYVPEQTVADLRERLHKSFGRDRQALRLIARVIRIVNQPRLKDTTTW